MKVLVVGTERSEGLSKAKDNKPGGVAYAIGKLYAAVALDQSRNGEKAMAKGGMGTEYQVEIELIRRIEHLPMPFHAELVIEDQMRFGQRVAKVMDIKPLSHAQVPPAPAALKAA